MAEHARKYVIYADGACIGNPGPGGWGVVFAEPPEDRRELSGGPYPRTTNNRMEITAAIEGLRAAPPGTAVILRSDSEYLVKTMTLGWKRNANLELWHELERETAVRKVRFEWVPGHAGDEWNERADRLARNGARGALAQSNVRPAPQTAEEHAARALSRILAEGESVRQCDGCGRLFVATSADQACCSLVGCQLAARRGR